MLTKNELDFLNKIPADKKVYIYQFDPKAVKVAEDLARLINNIFPDCFRSWGGRGINYVVYL